MEAFLFFMGLTKEQQRDKHRQDKANDPDRYNYGKKKRFINGEVCFFTNKMNRKINNDIHKPPKIIYGLNTNK